MAITVFADLILNNAVLSAGVQGRQIRRNERNAQINGAQYINAVWTQTLREYDWETVPLRRADWQYMETLHEVTQGGAYGFLLEDPKDSSVVTTASAWGLTQSLGSSQYQLYRRLKHVASGRYNDRKITRPRAAAFALYIGGVVKSTPADYTLDANTGIVTIPSNPSVADVVWTGRFYVPVHFMNDTIDWAMVAAGQDPDARYLAGQSVVLQEIRE